MPDGFPDGSEGKESACNTGDTGVLGLIPVLGRSPPWMRKWQLTPAFLPGKSHGQSGLAGSSPWGHKESDTTEQLRVHARRMQDWACRRDLATTRKKPM